MIAILLAAGLAAVVVALFVTDYLGKERERFLGAADFRVCGRQPSKPSPVLPPLSAPVSAPGVAAAPNAPAPPPSAPVPPPNATPGTPLLPQTLGRAVGGEPTVAQTDPPRDAALASLYQPVVRVAGVDRFWPVSLNTVFGERIGERGTQLDAQGEPPKDATLASIESGGTGDDYLDYPADLDQVQQQFCSVAGALGIPDSALAQWRTLPQALNPFRSAELYVYRTTDATYPHLPGGLISLEYWFFYPLNYLPYVVKRSLMLSDPVSAIEANLDYHEGDFEHVAVLIDPQTMQPRYLYMARHAADEARAFTWGDPRVQWQGTHPVVYAGFGSHASYNSCGVQERKPPRPDDWVLCNDNQLFTFNPDTTPLVDLRSVRWACWPGHFGQQAHGGFPMEFVDGPRAPLRQAENGSRACPAGPGGG